MALSKDTISRDIANIILPACESVSECCRWVGLVHLGEKPNYRASSSFQNNLPSLTPGRANNNEPQFLILLVLKFVMRQVPLRFAVS